MIWFDGEGERYIDGHPSIVGQACLEVVSLPVEIQTDTTKRWLVLSPW